MSFRIPSALKDVNSLATPSVLDVELNDVDIDRMMTHVLELAVKRGRRAATRTNAKDYIGYLTKLQQNENLVGFEGDAGLDVLDGWLRSSVVKLERGGLRRDVVQMGYLRPLTIAAYRSGMPKAVRHRRADVLAYRAAHRVMVQAGEPNPSARIADLYVGTFGSGTDLGQMPFAEPKYDGRTEVDIDTLLALRYLEGFEGNRNPTKYTDELDPPVPYPVDALGQDLTSFLALYGPLMPVSEAFDHVSALLALRLFQLPLITARSIRGLLAGGVSTFSTNPSEIYCDFTRRRAGSSDELSRQCVQRDLEIMRAFFGDRLLLRSLEDAVRLLPNAPDLGTTAEVRLRRLADLRNDDTVGIALRMKIREIESGLADDDDDGRDFIAQASDSGVAAADQLTAILVEGLRKRGYENQVKWFWSTGGIHKPYGVLAGTQSHKTTWRYAPRDQGLVTLVMMCFVNESGTGTAARLPIRELLRRLADRYGILIDVPPSDLDSADSRSGCAENLEAFTRQLRLLGCFVGLSDDFSAQFVTRPRGAVQ